MTSWRTNQGDTCPPRPHATISLVACFGWPGRPSPSSNHSRWPPARCAAGLDFLDKQNLRKVSPPGAPDGLLPAGHGCALGRLCRVPLRERRPGIVLLSPPIPGSGSEQGSHLAYTPRDQLPQHPSQYLISSHGNGSSICPVNSRTSRIREELTRPGSTSRTRVHCNWRHVPQAANNVVAATAATLLYVGSIRRQSSRLHTHCRLLRCYCAVHAGSQGRRAIENRGDSAQYLKTAPGHRRKEGKDTQSSCASLSSLNRACFCRQVWSGQMTERHFLWIFAD